MKFSTFWLGFNMDSVFLRVALSVIGDGLNFTYNLKTEARVEYCAASKTFFKKSVGQADLVHFGHLAQVDQGIAHASQSRVDAHFGDIGDFLEAQVVVDAHP